MYETATGKLAEATCPAPSDPEHVTVVVPTGNDEPLAGLQNGPVYGATPPDSVALPNTTTTAAPSGELTETASETLILRGDGGGGSDGLQRPVTRSPQGLGPFWAATATPHDRASRTTSYRKFRAIDFLER